MIALTICTLFFRNKMSRSSVSGCCSSNLIHLVRLRFAVLWERSPPARQITSSAYSTLVGFISLFLMVFQGSEARSKTGVPPSIRPNHIRNRCFLLLLLSRYTSAEHLTWLHRCCHQNHLRLHHRARCTLHRHEHCSWLHTKTIVTTYLRSMLQMYWSNRL